MGHKYIDQDVVPAILSSDVEDNLIELYFDDEPLESILYGVNQRKPSPANLFRAARICINGVINSFNEGNVPKFIAAASALGNTDMEISAQTCSILAGAIGAFFPYYPNPVMPYDLGPLKELLEKIWTIAAQSGDDDLQDKTGSLLFRWYEHHGRYEEARKVLARLIEIATEKGNRRGEALYLNNLGFEYLLESRWSEAIPYFEEATQLFMEADITFEMMNARANCWICRFEAGDFGDISSTEADVKEIMDFFTGSGRWYERKALVLMAKIEERKGNSEGAAQLVGRAIESAKNSNTRYPELDAKYLRALLEAQ